jgi:hypothetical protein
MAIRDLLWACPLCRREDGLRPHGKDEEVCTGCGARFRRGQRADIEVTHPGGEVEVHSASAWACRLPPEPSPLEPAGAAQPGQARVLRRARAEVRVAVGEDAVHRGREFVGAAERFGPPAAGELTLTSDALVFRPDSGDERRWPLEELTAIQPSSGTLQLKVRRQPLLALRFPDGSTRLWEESLGSALRAWYRGAGRGEIVEFQPRICVR